MRPSEVRRRILDDHEQIRRILNSIEGLGWRVIEGEEWPVAALRREARSFLDHLKQHMEWEDVYLKPALLKTGLFGPYRARKLDRDHRLQRRLLEDGIEKLEDADRDAITLARNFLDLVQLVRADMRSEEMVQLGKDVLRDPVAGVLPKTVERHSVV